MQTPYHGRAVISQLFNDVVITIPAKKTGYCLVFLPFGFSAAGPLQLTSRVGCLTIRAKMVLTCL